MSCSKERKSTNFCSFFLSAQRDYSTELQGSFTSPRYPNNYPNNALSNYHFGFNQNGSIEIDFLVFGLEQTSTCSYDYVKIYNVFPKSRILAATYCGNGPRKFTSSTNEVLVQFQSDRSFYGKGFFATYKFIKAGEMDFRCIFKSLLVNLLNNQKILLRYICLSVVSSFYKGCAKQRIMRSRAKHPLAVKFSFSKHPKICHS